MTPEHHLTLRREGLLFALERLPALHVVLLARLLLRACPSTARVWTTRERLGADTGLSALLLDNALRGLESSGLVSIHSEKSRLIVIELGALYVRRAEVPANLPVAPAI